MKTQILNFRKTDHFIYRQWDRNVDDCVLKKVLMHTDQTKCKKAVVVTPHFLKNKGVHKGNKCLVLIIKDNLLLTTYWQELETLLFCPQEKTHFQIL